MEARLENRIIQPESNLNALFSLLFPSQMTYADITFFNLCNVFAEGKPIVPKQISEFLLLVEHYKRVLNVPEIKAWIDKRPKTDH